MSSLLSAELSATCSALGTFNKKTGKYMIDDFTLNTVKDLIRYLRRDGEDHEIRQHFGQTKVLQTDLLPMLVDHWENTELFDVALRLIVNLTNPVLLLYREEIPIEKTARHNYLQILSHLQSYKEEAFTKVETWQVFAKKLAKVLEIEWSERDEDTGLIIERILILIRNVLHVPADLDKERRPDNDASVHDQVLWALNQAGILDIILYMSSENEKQYFMHIIEILSHLLREQNPTSLADAALQRSVDEKLKDEQELLMIRMSETKERLNKIKQYSATRHSRFGGTYVIQNMKSISDNELICLKPLNKISKLDFNGSKKSKLVKPKNRRPMESGTMERRSAFAIRLFLKEFCIEFLNSSYNSMMHYVKDILVRAKAQQNDESYYLWAVKFFMEFNRGHNFNVGLVRDRELIPLEPSRPRGGDFLAVVGAEGRATVGLLQSWSETMSVPMFHYVQQQMDKYYDMIKVEKKKFSVWVRRLHLALRAYKELLNTLQAMDKSSDLTVKESAKVLKSNIFYVLEYREFILFMFLNYDENKMPRSYLLDLVETVHLFLKMLEHYCKKTGLVVQKKVRKKAKTKTKAKKPVVKKSNPVRKEVPIEEVRTRLTEAFVTPAQEFPPPFDAASDVPIDSQREECMKKIQKLLRDQRFGEAIGMFRAAREVWPEGVFGSSDIEEEEEREMLETIYSTDLGVEKEEDDDVETQENSENEEDDEEEEERSTTVVETDFDFQDFIQRFCHPRIVSACASLLERYDKNTPHTNHCIIKMLHRIAWDCKRPSMMFQASLFLTFQKILANPISHFKELEKFAIFIIRKFSEIAANNSKVFIELLFWKSSKDAIEIEHGYDIYNDPRDKPGRGGWTEAQEEELRSLYMENQTNPQTNQDVIDWILENLIDQTRTRRGVIKKLKELGLIFKAPTKRSNRERNEKVSKVFSEEEDNLLKELWEQYGDSSDPMALIMPRMPRTRQKRSYVDRLLELGIIQDKKQCRKRKQKTSRTKSTAGDGDKSNESSTEESDSDSESDVNTVTNRQAKPVQKKKKEPSKRRVASRKVELSASEIAQLLVKAVNDGYSEALNWLAECLEEVALDQEAEGYDPTAEGTPLVPISGESVEAMESKLFIDVLKSVGIVPPGSEQETYWRIPSDLHYETIRKRREIILKAINKELVIDSNEITANENANSKPAEESSDDEDLFDNLRKMRDNNDVIVNSSVKIHPRKRIRNMSMNDGPERYSNNRIENTNNTPSGELNDYNDLFDNLRTSINDINVISTKSQKRNRSVDSDDDNSREKIQKINDDVSNDEDDILSFAKRTLDRTGMPEPDTEDILNDLPKHYSDDSDKEDDEIVLPAKRKKMRMVIDDDSD